MEIPTLITFAIAALVVLIIPGPGVLYVVTRSFTQGRGVGLVSVLGLALGAFVHVVGAMIGLSAILMASATAFGIVKLLGAAYLIYLGIRKLLEKSTPADMSEVKPDSLPRVFWEGVVISVLNPKIAIFFLAFFPQFISPGDIPVHLQFLVLGLIYVLLALLSDGTYALLASQLRHTLGNYRTIGRISKTVSGWIFVGLGASLALAEKNR